MIEWGGTHSIPIDTRIIASSNRDLETAVEQGDFREDLFFRLNVIPVTFPPLRERKKDIHNLAEHFLGRFAAENGKNGLAFDSQTPSHLENYAWPGNVRELQNAIERAVVLSDGPALTPGDFPFNGTLGKAESNGSTIRAGISVSEIEKALIFKTLEHCNDNRTRAAEMLDISVRTLRNKLKEYRG